MLLEANWPGGLTAPELGDAAMMTVPQVHQVVRTLYARGDVGRRSELVNGRSVFVWFRED